MIDMPERTIELLFRFLNQNDGKLSNRAREKALAALTDQESERIEAVYRETFNKEQL